MGLSLILICAIVLLDQLSKQWAANVLKEVGSIPLIDGVFHLTYTENTGAAFSLLEGGRTFFILATVVLLSTLVLLLRRRYFKNRWGRLATLFIIGGALGNFFDRVRLSYVIDMFDFRLIGFAIFNVADVFITTGGIMMIIYFILTERQEMRNKAAALAEAGPTDAEPIDAEQINGENAQDDETPDH